VEIDSFRFYNTRMHSPTDPLDIPAPSEWSRLWALDPRVVFLNHGSFGACPRAVLQKQQVFRERMEGQPIRFLHRELEGLLDESRGELAGFLGCQSDDLGFVPNATAGVNTVLRSLHFRPGDELLVTDHEYNACRNALNFAAASSGASVVVAAIPFPCRGEDEVCDAVLSRVTSRTRLALFDHVTSPTGIILPAKRIISELNRCGVDTLVDGAHAPGMLPLDLDALGAAYYTGNCHKWVCAPKGAAFLHVRRDRQKEIRPLSISHGANSWRTDRSLFRLEFDWTGTFDPTPYLCAGESVRYLASLLPGGWPELMHVNRTLAIEARRHLCEILQIEPPCPEGMIGTLATLPLPDDEPGTLRPPLFLYPLQDALLERFGIEVPIVFWPAPPGRCLRISAQLYNAIGQYEYLGTAMLTLLREEAKRP
jgi:isopenicillin-N epimerase